MRTIIILLTICFVLGCAEVPGKQGEQALVRSAEMDYRTATALMKKNKFNDAIALYRKIMTEAPGTQTESNARYQIALAHTLTDNPEKDYVTAVKEFEEFIQLHPADGQVIEAQNWISTLSLCLDLKKQNESLRKDNEQLRKKIEELKRLDIRNEERRNK